MNFPSPTDPPARHVIPNAAARRFFLPLCSCKAVGLRSEESLFLFSFPNLQISDHFYDSLPLTSAMTIVVWNCKMALSRKRQHLYNLRPDIAVIPECSQNCLKLCMEDGLEGRWFGDNPRKGLGVLVANPLHIVRAGKPRGRWVVPIEITGGPGDFRLIAVWTMPVQGSHVSSYIGQLYEAIVNNPQWFTGKPTIVCGDFNSNKFWDHVRKINNHSAVVKALEKRRLASAYHHFFSESQGQETQPTYYFWHHKNRPYHIDYVFLPQQWASQIKTVELGSHAAWSKLSDHVPLFVDVTVSPF